MNKKIKIVTHDGKFHADEVFAIAILKEIYSDVSIVRTRDSSKFKNFDFLIDVGGIYDHSKKCYDHHQIDFSEVRDNGLPYSSVGLIWKHYWKKIVDSKEEYLDLDEKLIQFIDAADSGVDFSKGIVSIYGIGQVIDLFHPSWNSSESWDVAFLEAVKFAQFILEKEFVRMKVSSLARKIVLEEIKKQDGEYLILPSTGLGWRKILLDYPKFKFVIFPDGSGRWISSAINVKKGSFKRRMYFPESWGGLRDFDLEKESGVKGAKFCHKDRFICVADSKEGILELTNKALEQSF